MSVGIKVLLYGYGQDVL